MLLFALALACATSFRMDSPRAHGPRWENELLAARVACGVAGTRAVDLGTGPYRLGWHAHVPCSYVR
jgi:hypothetical protein